jgi:tetratricopeptide (TPR) repeat protein
MTVTSRPPGKGVFVIDCIALKKDLSRKDVAGRIRVPYKRLSRWLRGDSLSEKTFKRILPGTGGTPAEVAAATACFEALEPDPDLTDEEREVIETEILARSRRQRAALKRLALRSREAPPLDGYPEPSAVEPSLWRAGEQVERLRGLIPTERLARVRAEREFHGWAFCVEAAEESRRATSQDLRDAASWAELAAAAAERVQGPEAWRSQLRGMAGAVAANVLRVEGRLKAARAGIRKARPLWLAGSDPLQILDPGLLFELDASLCRAERRFGEALDRLEEALRVGRRPERYLINKGFTLEVMGDYGPALEALLKAEPRLDRAAEPRLWYQHRFNTAILYVHLERHEEAAGLVEGVRETAADLGDEIFLLRVTWLEGRLAAGLGRRREALALLERAREGFAARKMSYDVALALLETAALLLADGWTAEVKALATDLAELFKKNGIHPEALAALRIFHEAVEQETATAELARRVLRFLFRARYDQGLRFSLG